MANLVVRVRSVICSELGMLGVFGGMVSQKHNVFVDSDLKDDRFWLKQLAAPLGRFLLVPKASSFTPLMMLTSWSNLLKQ